MTNIIAQMFFSTLSAKTDYISTEFPFLQKKFHVKGGEK